MHIERKNEWYRTEAMRRFEVKDAPPVEAGQRGYRPVTWLPDTVRVHWTDGAMVKVEMFGRTLRRDGSVGTREMSSTWHGNPDNDTWRSGYSGAGQVGDMPDWLLDLIKGQQEPRNAK